MRRAQTTEVVALHRTGKTFTDRCARNVDFLTQNKVLGRDLCTDFDQVVFAHAELSHFALWLNFCFRKMATHRFRGTLGFGCTGAELNSSIAVTVCGALVYNLQTVKGKNGHRDLLAVFHEQAGHAHFLRDNSGTHVQPP